MVAVAQANLNITDNNNLTIGTFAITVLPSRENDSPIFDYRDDIAYSENLEKLQLVESGEYRYQITIRSNLSVEMISVDKSEIVTPDDETGLSGRIRTGLYVGGISLGILTNGTKLGSVKFEVISRKLNYLSHYRWMLKDISSLMTEIIMRHFAPSFQRFSPDFTREATSIYQRFAFLHSLITDTSFEVAISQIISSPFKTWVTEDATRISTRGIRGRSNLVRSFTKPGARLPYNDPSLPHVRSIPLQLQSSESTEILDNAENRFIKFVLEHWRNTAYEVQRVLQTARRTYSTERGIRETEEVISVLTQILNRGLFRIIGAVTGIPASSTVLQQRAGYREIYRMYIQSEVASHITWDGGDEIYSAGKKDVAALYEIWVFLKIAELTAVICNKQAINVENLIHPEPQGFDIRLQRGRKLILSGEIERLGRHIKVELFYNKTFSALSQSISDGSWSRNMRPDYSLCFSLLPTIGSQPDSVWIHFDAKYRVDNPKDIFGDDVETETNYKRDDLLTMHAYRDAVRRSEGAYVIYPGTENQLFRRFHEILPSIGAFPLMPTENSSLDTSSGLLDFINSIVDNLASQSTVHERGRFWNRLIYEDAHATELQDMYATSILEYPPDDIDVLLVKFNDPELYKWCQQASLLVVPMGENGQFRRDIAKADLVLLYFEDQAAKLYGMDKNFRLLRSRTLVNLGYPVVVSSDHIAFGINISELVYLSALTDSVAYRAHIQLSTPSHEGLVISEPIRFSQLLL